MSDSITVCIPTYHRSAYLRKSILSVLANSEKNLELLVVDNASPDSTPEVVASFHDPRLRYIRNEKNIGPIGNFWKCIQNATNPRIVFLTDDDLMLPGALQEILEYFNQENPAAFKTDLMVHLEKSRQAFYYSYSDCTLIPGKSNLKSSLRAIFSAHVMTGLALDKSKIDIDEIKRKGLESNIYPSMAVIGFGLPRIGYLAKPCFLHTWENELFWGDINPEDEVRKLDEIVDVIYLAADRLPHNDRSSFFWEFLNHKSSTQFISPYTPAFARLRGHISKKDLRILFIKNSIRYMRFHAKQSLKSFKNKLFTN